MTLTQTEQEELRICIAEEMSMADFHHDPDDGMTTSGNWGSRKEVPPYTTSLDAIQAACLERFKTSDDRFHFAKETGSFIDMDHWCWQLTALEWCIAFARTAKIWRYTTEP